MPRRCPPFRGLGVEDVVDEAGELRPERVALPEEAVNGNSEREADYSANETGYDNYLNG